MVVRLLDELHEPAERRAPLLRQEQVEGERAHVVVLLVLADPAVGADEGRPPCLGGLAGLIGIPERISGARSLRSRFQGPLRARQLVAGGERVLDVQPKLAARVWLLQAGNTGKNDPNDARSVKPAAERAVPPRSPRVIGQSARSAADIAWARKSA